MKTVHTIGLLAVLALFLFTGCSCGDDDDDDNGIAPDDTVADDTADDTVSDDTDDDDDTSDDTEECEESPASTNAHTLAGLEYLELAAGGPAREEFIAALSDNAADEDAIYGRILAGTLLEFDTIGVIALYVNMILGYDPGDKADDDSLQSLIDAIVDSALQSLVLEFTDDINVYGPQAMDIPCLSLELEKMPIILDLETVAEPGGNDWDHSEIMASMGFTDAFGGLIRLLTVLNFDFDLSYVMSIGEIDWDAYTTTEIISIVVDMLHNVLNDAAFPDFLTMSGDGYDDFLKAQSELGLGFRYAADTYDLIRAETDDQTDDILAYVDKNGDGVFGIDDYFVIPPWGELDDEQMAAALAFENLFIALGDSFLDRTTYDQDPATDTPFDLAVLNDLLDAFGLPSLIPHIDVDLAAWFDDASADGFRNGLRTVVNLLYALLPAAPPY